MKIASIFAAMPGNQSGLINIKNIVSETLTDLGIEPEEINLGYRSLPYYDGIKSEYMNTIADAIRTSNGVIFYVSASFGLPGALLQTLAEHFSYPEYADIMADKNCFIIVNCDDGTGAAAISAMDLTLYNMGAFTGARVLVDKGFMEKMEQGSKNFILIERLCEDYYRSLRQQRILYRPGASIVKVQSEPVQLPVSKPALNAEIKYEEKVHSNTLAQSLKPIAYEQKVPSVESSLSDGRQKDIDEISNFFAKKFKVNDDESLEFNETVQISTAPSAQKITLAQKTSALTHYFKAGQADGLKAVISLNISGKDAFEGYIEINGVDCDFHMGLADAADVSIIAEGSKWSEIIKGKTSAQKAFMIGQIKVRGNFVLLSRFDQLFDFGRNSD